MNKMTGLFNIRLKLMILYIDSQYKFYCSSDINFWDGGAPPPQHSTLGAPPQTLSLRRGCLHLTIIFELKNPKEVVKLQVALLKV